MPRATRAAPPSAAATTLLQPRAPRKDALEHRRQELLDAGQRTFLRKGFAAATVDDVTRAAGVAKGTFYLYFKSKDDLLAALGERFVEGCRTRIESLAGPLPPNDWAGRLDAWVEGGIRHYLDHLELHDLVFRGSEHHDGSMAQSPLVVQFAELLRAGAAANAWRAGNPELIALFLVYGLHGIVDHIVSSRAADRKSLIQDSQDMVRRVLGLNLPVIRQRFSPPSAR